MFREAAIEEHVREQISFTERSPTEIPNHASAEPFACPVGTGLVRKAECGLVAQIAGRLQEQLRLGISSKMYPSVPAS